MIMPKKQSKGKRSRRAGGAQRTGRNFSIQIPAVFHVDEGKTNNITAEQLFPDDFFKGIPWRLRSIRAEVSCKSTFDITSNTTIIEPAIFQIRLNSAAADNVESITSLRMTAIPGQVRTRTLRMKNPNPWKEDEQRGQWIIQLDNILITGTSNTTVFVLLTSMFQFGPIAFDVPVKFHPRCSRDDGGESGSSSLSVL